MQILIVLPYGNLNPAEGRAAQLEKILQHLAGRATAHPKHKFFFLVAEQISPKKYFNRGALINVGVWYFREHIGAPTHIIFHDIDMLPNADLFQEYLITSDSKSLVPINSPTFQKEYGFDRLAAGAGIYLTTLKNFERANGFPNNFWGWGGEDNALDARYRLNNIRTEYVRHGNFASTDKQRRSNAEKMQYLKKNKLRNMCVWELLAADKKGWKKNGYAQRISQVQAEEITPRKNYVIIRLQIRLPSAKLSCP